MLNGAFSEKLSTKKSIGLSDPRSLGYGVGVSAVCSMWGGWLALAAVCSLSRQQSAGVSGFSPSPREEGRREGISVPHNPLQSSQAVLPTQRRIAAPPQSNQTTNKPRSPQHTPVGAPAGAIPSPPQHLRRSTSRNPPTPSKKFAKQFHNSSASPT